MTVKERELAVLKDRIARLTKQCLDMQHENASLKHTNKQAFEILRKGEV